MAIITPRNDVCKIRDNDIELINQRISKLERSYKEYLTGGSFYLFLIIIFQIVTLIHMFKK